ncbi:hypothetical protein [Paracoccus sp. S3-43]|uniref:hypothetical protein n=1 Tax=Paracoccus sp. S3-43 TaxID=3030011 RepID=UPI0023B15EDA|nr:hypothetical protein [Paracoccus sp. S3-43]WEF23354.1 hypothetical protein PXD02_11070 [Paracoccus sp. S3-43]
MAGAGRTGQGAGRPIVHLGVRKTGGTAIQRHPRRHAEGLADVRAVRSPDEGSPVRTGRQLRRLNGLALNPHAHGRIVDPVARAEHLFAADVPQGTS